MATWVRQGDPLAQWHLLDQPEARVGDMGRGVVLAACGLSLGHERPLYSGLVMDAREMMNVALGRTSLVVAAGDGPSG